MDNPNVSQVIIIGCPRNFGVLLQEMGRAGRRPGAKADEILLFNEFIDDKRLGLWLKLALDCQEEIIQCSWTKQMYYQRMKKVGDSFALPTMESAFLGHCPIFMVVQMIMILQHALQLMLPFVQFAAYLMLSARKVVIYRITCCCYFKPSKP